MKNYIFITKEGCCSDPEGNDIENCQVLGWGQGENVKEAFKKSNEEFDGILNTGFDEVIAFELKYLDHYRYAEYLSLKEFERGD